MRNLNCWDINLQIDRFVNKKRLNIKVLSDQKKNDLFTNFKKKYIKPGAYIGHSISEVLNYEGAIGTNDPESWRWIKDFNTGKPIVLIFNKSVEFRYYEFPNTKTFVELYDNLPLIEFYIVDYTLDYLLAYNHSQCLTAMGKAADWLESYDLYKQWCKKVRC